MHKEKLQMLIPQELQLSHKNSGMQVAVLNKKIKADLYLANLLY